MLYFKDGMQLNLMKYTILVLCKGHVLVWKFLNF